MKLTKVLKIFKIQQSGKKWQSCVSSARDSMLLKFVSVTWNLPEEPEALDRQRKNHKYRLNWQWWPFSWECLTKLKVCTKTTTDMTCTVKYAKVTVKLTNRSRYHRNTTESIWKITTIMLLNFMKHQIVSMKLLISTKDQILMSRKFQECTCKLVK